jgi:hypothetical protein
MKHNGHLGEGCVYGRAADLDGNHRVESRYRRLERLEGEVLVREDTEFAFTNTQSDTTRDVGLVRTEPGIAGGVLSRSG